MSLKKIINKKWLFDNWPFIFIFLFFLLINFLSPPIGDDWEVATWFSVSAKGNILTLLKSIYWNWKNFNGRGLSLLLTSYFCYYKVLWNFFSAGMFTYLIYFLKKNTKDSKNKLPIIILGLFLLSVSDNIRQETYSMICANVGFILPFILILLYSNVVKNDLNNISKPKKYSKKNIFLIFLFCLIISTLMENISAGFTITLAILNLYIFLKTKNINKLLFASFISSFLGSIFMFTSPGMHTGREVYNNSLGLLGTFQLSLPQNINLIIQENNFIFFTITLVLFLSIISNSIFIKKPLKYFYLIYISFCLLILFVSISNNHLPIPLFVNQILLVFLTNNFIGSIFWLFFLVLFLIPITSLYENKNTFIFLHLIAIFSLIAASLITQTGARIISICVFIFMIIGCKILDQINISNKIYKILYWLIIFGIFIQINRLLVIYLNIYKTQKIRQSIIDNTIVVQHQNLWDYNNQLDLPSFEPNALYHTANPTSDNIYHYNNFIEYTRLNPKTKIIFK